MARPFSYPQVTALNPGEFCVVKAAESFGKFMRRCRGHAERAGKEFSFMQLPDDEGFQVARVEKSE